MYLVSILGFLRWVNKRIKSEICTYCKCNQQTMQLQLDRKGGFDVVSQEWYARVLDGNNFMTELTILGDTRARFSSSSSSKFIVRCNRRCLKVQTNKPARHSNDDLPPISLFGRARVCACSHSVHACTGQTCCTSQRESG